MLIEKIVSVLSDSPRAFMTLKDWVLRWEGTFPKFFILLSLVAQHLSLLHWGLKSTITKRIRFWYRPEQPNCHYFWWQIVQIKLSRSVHIHIETWFWLYEQVKMMNLSLSSLKVKKWVEHIAQCGNCRNFLSPFICKNSVKSTQFLLYYTVVDCFYEIFS